MSAEQPRIRRGAFLLARRLRAPMIVLILVYGVATIGFTLVDGVRPDGEPWRMNFLHAFYFVSFLGTTIGLGEIPYPFSDAQRLWATFSIYATVIAWLYGIGELLATLQDPLFRRIRAEGRFTRAVRRQAQPFVIVCGYGDAGALVTRELTEDGIGVVVIDRDPARVDAVEVEELAMPVPALQAAAVEPAALLRAGITHPQCRAVLALTGDDRTNLTVTVSARLLAPQCTTVCVAHHHERQAAMARVGASSLINPYDTFAERLADAITRPSLHVVYEALTTQAMLPTSPVRHIPRGNWLVCGYGRFGRTVRRQLQAIGIRVSVVSETAPEEADPAIFHGADLLDPALLQQAGIAEADGIVVATADDTLSLALAQLARELRPGIFTVVRQDERRNTPLFRALGAEIATLSGYIVAAEVLRMIRAPLLARFLRLARHQDEAWCEALLLQLRARIGAHTVESWTVNIDAEGAPAALGLIAAGTPVALGTLSRTPESPADTLPVLALMVQRDDGKLLLPGPGTVLRAGDRILFCGRTAGLSRLRRCLHDTRILQASIGAAERATVAMDTGSTADG